MKFKLLFSTFFVVISFHLTLAQGIRGRITTTRGEAIPFATIYVPKSTTGTTSNIDGKYELKLQQGKYIVLFQCLGYETQSVELTVGAGFQEKNIQLSVQEYQIPEVKVMASGEDPAYYVVRRAIAMGPYYSKQVSKYSCKVYMKGTGIIEQLKGIGSLFKSQVKEAGLELNKPIVVETLNQVDFELPDQMKQKVLATRSTMKNFTIPGLQIGSALDNALYQDSKDSPIAPLGKVAMKSYKYKLEGIYTEQGRTINKIKVTPVGNGNNLYSGYIYIADLYWYVQSADLSFKQEMANLHFHLLNAEVNRNTFMPVNYNVDVDVSGLGVKAKFKGVVSVSDYHTTLNPALDHRFLDRITDQQLKEQQAVQEFLANEKKEQEKAEKSTNQSRIDALMQKPQLSNRETMKLNRLIETEAKRNSPPEPLEIKSAFNLSPKQEKNDSAYWSSLRPVPLTDIEKKSFASKDSFLQKAAKPAFKDSVENEKRKFKVKHILTGKTYNYSVDSTRRQEFFTIPGIINPGALSFNSVDGLRAELPFRYSVADSLGHHFLLQSELGYAFKREKLDASVSFARKWDGVTNSWFRIGLGTTTSDYNRVSGMSVVDNDFYTLWFEKNYKRYYRRDFLQLNASRDLANGLNLSFTLNYSDNQQLSNHSDYSLIKYNDREIQPNIPANNLMQRWQLDNHQTFGALVALEYTPHYRYRVRNHSKIYASSKYPTFSMSYVKAFSGVLGSDSKYDLLKAGIRQTFDFGVANQFSYQVGIGGFTNKDKLYFEDFKHFNALPVNFLFSSYANSFRLLPMYKYSTDKRFLDTHFNLTTRKLILKQLPLISNAIFSERLFVNYLNTPGMKNYMETGYGLSNLFLAFNLEVVAGFENGKYQSVGFKVSMNLK